jgi:NDP-sugar pyrophosphorylase family protein
MQLLIPMAGHGSRFTQAGHTCPKPLIPIRGQTMIERVVENLEILRPVRTVFVVLEQHYDSVNERLSKLVDFGCFVVPIPTVLPGAAHSCLAAAKVLDLTDAVVVANCDQLMLWSYRDFTNLKPWEADGIIWTFSSNSDKNSYVEIDTQGRVLRVREKEVISNHATCGVYYWRRALDMLWSCQKMIDKGITTNGEAYLAPSYNELIAAGAEIRTLPVMKHYPIGTPEDLEAFCASQ